MIDCEQISKYHHNAYKGKIVQETVKECGSTIFEPIKAEISKRARKAPRMIFLAGNHENRVNTYFDTFLAPLGGRDFVNIKEFLGLGFCDEFIPYMESFEICPGTHLCHGFYVRSGAGASVKRHMEYYPGNLIMGHTHRIGNCTHSTVNGSRRGWEIGHMSVEPPGWTPYSNWQRSAGTILLYSEDGQYVDVSISEVIGPKGKEMVMLNGKEY